MTATMPKSTKKPIQPPSRTWTHIGMDLNCDLPVSSEGFKHVLVTVCYLSKFVVVRPLKRKNSEEVIKIFKISTSQWMTGYYTTRQRPGVYKQCK